MTATTGSLPPTPPPGAATRRPWRLLPVALLLAFLVGEEALLFSLQGRVWALQRVRRDTSGAWLDAPPDDTRRARHDGLDFEYGMGMDPARASSVGAPAVTGEDDGLEDLRRDIRWVRSRLRTGEPYMPPTWRLEDALTLAVEPGRRFHCYSYACATVSVAEAQGYAARVVYLGRHITSEVYLPARRQWVMADATYDVIPYGAEGGPLSLLETLRHLRAGQPVEWRPVTGEAGDDATLDEPTRRNVEAMIRAGEFVIKDGALTFGQLGHLPRLWDVVTGRARVLQLALDGQPAPDHFERRTWAWLLLWNAVALVTVALYLLTPRRRDAEA